ncbi:Yop proteins translocation protein L [Polaromonas vacuolata]|jgi:type III secretion protein L|uniref:Type 3 secretion system stator protein n=1 Tax=Polaromonas vacuolata TaxID=37448 RepID=A0A6H2H529_9BURK|nr:HrpE/YscL family type III secretion apparatus protein [Polaromonas vacuolata]QJC54950.1 Yop proteins translocation protein L [Polaromonas vacuolata]
MAFILPVNPLTPLRRLSIGIDPSVKVVRAHELVALRTAEQAVIDACAQADTIREDAKQAYEDERQRGYLEGQEAARLEQVEQMIENVSRTIDYFSRVESRMVDLVMQAVQKIIDDYDDNARILLTVKNVLSVVRNQKHMTLRLHPQQVALVKERIGSLLSDYPGVGYLDIVADPRLNFDACILESDIGMVEASMEGQLSALRRAFEKVLGSRV